MRRQTTYTFQASFVVIVVSLVTSHVLLLVTELKLCWLGLLPGWVTFCEISVVGIFSGRLFSIYSCTSRHQCDAGIAKQCS